MKDAAEKGIKAWDSQVYRLENFQVRHESLFLKFGLIPYSTRMGIKKYRNEIDSLGPDYFSKSLYVSAFIETRDSKYLMGRLSGKTLNEKTVDFIGGVLSFDEIKIKSSGDIWKIMYRELEEEANIKKEDIQSAILIGGAVSWYSNVALVFYIKLKIDSETAMKGFNKRSDDELSELLCLDRSELERMMRDAKKSVFLELLS